MRVSPLIPEPAPGKKSTLEDRVIMTGSVVDCAPEQVTYD